MRAPQVNDKIRLFGILAGPENRDSVTRLNTGKNTSRSQCDGPMSCEDQIFHDLGIQFNDPGITVGMPEDAKNLETYLELDMNDMSRINIK